MAIRDEIEKVFRDLYTHRCKIADVLLADDAVITDIPENIKIIDTLLKHQLADRWSDDGQVRLAPELKQLLHGKIRNYRRLNDGSNIARRIMDIEHLIAGYHEMRVKSRHEDADQFLKDCRDVARSLITESDRTIRSFSQQISDGFGFASSLDARIKLNEMAINQAEQMNRDLADLTRDKMVLLSGSDTKLGDILLKMLPSAMDPLRKELTSALHNLNELLSSLRRQSELDELLNTFVHQYRRNPGYEPLGVDALHRIPAVLTRLENDPILGRPNPHDCTQAPELAALLIGLRRAPRVADQLDLENRLVVADITDELAMEEVEPPPLWKACYKAFSLVESKGAVTARETYELAPNGATWEHWIIGMMNFYYSLRQEQRQYVGLVLDENQDADLNGLFWISDLTVIIVKSAVAA